MRNESSRLFESGENGNWQLAIGNNNLTFKCLTRKEKRKIHRNCVYRDAWRTTTH